MAFEKIGIGADRIVRERGRQIRQEGYTPEGDVGRSQELLAAATAYILYVSSAEEGVLPTLDEIGYPWHHTTWKPEPRDHALAKAGALIAAAIDARQAEREAENGSPE